jgi:magnesium chelatase family protein
MPSRILSAALSGLEAETIEVEADSGGGDFGQIKIVGLPDASVSEAKERVRSALKNCGLTFPRRKITVNLAPANLKKHGSAFDLPIAMSILALQNKFAIDWSDCLLAGELSLDGTVRPIRGVLALAIKAHRLNIKTLFIPATNALEAGLISGLEIFPVQTLAQLIAHCQKKQLIAPWKKQADRGQSNSSLSLPPDCGDFSLIAGQSLAKRALEIATAGGHNILLSGPPGTGKTLLAKASAGIMPPLSEEERLEVTTIYSIAGQLTDYDRLISIRPWRAPHHSASLSSLLGGGVWPHPGEISLAHCGILFLDELPEFSRAALESLRQPLEEGYINISRSTGGCRFPSKFILVAALNPCPCGYWGDPRGRCHCSATAAESYRRRISGPILERFDIQTEAPALDFEIIRAPTDEESSAIIRSRVCRAREWQRRRQRKSGALTNAELNNEAAKRLCLLDQSGQMLLRNAMEKFSLSARSYYRLLKLSRTIADLAEEKQILSTHLAEAIQYRPRLN